MKRTFFIFFSITLLMAMSLSAQKKAEVLLKFSKEDKLIRIVLEAGESFINSSKITTSPSQIKIEFSQPFSLTSPKDTPFEVVPSEKLLVINLKEKGEIKFFRLSSPGRLVFDIQKKEILPTKQPEKQPEKQTEKQPPAVSHIFAIDAGHGGYDFGITSGNVSEKDLSLSIAKDISALFLKKGRKVVFTRKVDQYISLAERINFVNQKRPDLFISFHLSLSPNFVIYTSRVEDQSSSEIADFYSLSARQMKYVSRSKALADSIGKALKDDFKTDTIRREMFVPILNSVGCPAFLIELPSPKFVSYDQQTKTKLFNAIMNGITAYGQ